MILVLALKNARDKFQGWEPGGGRAARASTDPGHLQAGGSGVGGGCVPSEEGGGGRSGGPLSSS